MPLRFHARQAQAGVLPGTFTCVDSPRGWHGCAGNLADRQGFPCFVRGLYGRSPRAIDVRAARQTGRFCGVCRILGGVLPCPSPQAPSRNKIRPSHLL